MYKKHKLDELETDTLYYDFEQMNHFYLTDTRKIIYLTMDEVDSEFGPNTPANFIEGIIND